MPRPIVNRPRSREDRIQSLVKPGTLAPVKNLYNYAEALSILSCARRTFFRWLNKGYLVRGPGRTITAISLTKALNGDLP
jgi:hypothetical protein